MIKITCLIPAYNEGARISGVLRSVAGHPMLHEIIVIDGNSTDNTREVVAGFPGVSIFQQEGRGKSKAIYEGIKRASGDFVFLLDSDLIGVTKDNIADLLEPVLSNKCDVSINLCRNAPLPWRLIGLDYITGERVLPRSLLMPELEDIFALPGYGLEVFLNKLIIKNKLRLAVVPWPNVTSPYKFRKNGWAGLKDDIKMLWQIFQTISIFQSVYQIVQLLRQKV